MTDAELGAAYRERQRRAARAQSGKPTPAQLEARRASLAKARAKRWPESPTTGN